MKRRIVILYLILLFRPVFVHAQEIPFIQEIRAFKQADSANSPPRNAILFVGSSSFRLWKTIQEDFPGYTIINRGFGGSSLPDVIRFAREIIFPYQARQIVIYCGENDLAASDTVTAEMVVDRFKTLYRLIRQQMPGVPVVYVSIKPSPSRERLLPKVMAANEGIRKFLRHKKQTRFVDVFNLMTDRNGKINRDIFVEDRLHMNRQGYEIWKKAITPYLLKD